MPLQALPLEATCCRKGMEKGQPTEQMEAESRYWGWAYSREVYLVLLARMLVAGNQFQRSLTLFFNKTYSKEF